MSADTEPMKDVFIRSLPVRLWDSVRLCAAVEGLSIREYMLKVLEAATHKTLLDHQHKFRVGGDKTKKET